MDAPEAIGVAIVGGTPALRAGLAALLASRDAFQILESNAGDAEADVLIAVGAAAARDEGTLPVVAVVESSDEAAELISAGRAVAVLGTDAEGDQIAAAVAAAAAGLMAVSQSLGIVPVGPGRLFRPADGGEGLTGRELEVLTLIADGLPNKAIAAQLGISENTVKFHAGSILAKLGAASRAEAVMLAARRGLLAV